MIEQRIKQLATGADAAQAEVERLDRQIATALADGDDEGLAELRQRRRALIDEADDAASAIAVLEARANDPNAKLRAAMAAGALRDARRQAESYKATAQEFDEALETLEAKFDALETSARLLSRSLIAAGLSDNARIHNTLLPSLRWALWRDAPKLAKAIGLAHTPWSKRQTLRDSASRVIPNIPAE